MKPRAALVKSIMDANEFLNRDTVASICGVKLRTVDSWLYEGRECPLIRANLLIAAVIAGGGKIPAAAKQITDVFDNAEKIGSRQAFMHGLCR